MPFLLCVFALFSLHLSFLPGFSGVFGGDRILRIEQQDHGRFVRIEMDMAKCRWQLLAGAYGVIFSVVVLQGPSLTTLPVDGEDNSIASSP